MFNPINLDTQKAAELLKENRTNCQDISTAAIAQVIANHLEALVEEALADPESFFRNNYRFWSDLDKTALAEEQQQHPALAA